MLVFWALATGMTLLALAFVLVPLLRARGAAAGPSARDATLEVLRGQRQEIEADIATGSLPAEARDEALAELVERAGEDLPAETATGKAAPATRPWLAAAATTVAIPALAFGLYAAVGSPGAVDVKAMPGLSAGGPGHDKELVAMIENLAQKVRERPDDARGWELLARSMMSLGRYGEAAAAYEHLAKLAPGDAQVLADYADALGMAQGRSLLGKPREIAAQALAADPRHPKALALAGTAAMDAKDWNAAMGYWQRLADTLPPDSQDAAQLRSIMDEVRQRAGPGYAFAEAPKLAQGPGPAPAAKAAAPAKAEAPAKAAAAPAPANATTANGISGSVALAPDIARQVNGKEHLFVFARAEGGPRVPLAVVKLRADALPYQFALDDSQAMAPGMNISSAQAVRIEARISRSGDVKAQPGDLVGTSEVVKPGARGVKVVVDKVVP
jgi:cytochrome c-type biogenesis protein CcmH